MAEALRKAVNALSALFGTNNSLKAVKEYVNTRKLYRYKLRNYEEHVKGEDLKALVTEPCPRTQGNLDSKNIKIAKMLRNHYGLWEKETCNKCPLQKSCKAAIVPSKVSPTIADYIRYLHALSQDPPSKEELKVSYSNLTSSLQPFIDNIDLYPVPLKTLPDGPTDPKSPIPGIKPGRKRVKIPRKCVWTPRPEEIINQQKVERRKERRASEQEMSTLLKRTAKLIKKSHKKHKRINKGKKSIRK